MKKIAFLTLLSLIVFGSCSDFLDIKPNDIIIGDALAEENLDALTSPLYNKAWYDYNNQFYYAMEGMAYNLEHNADYIGYFTHLTFTGQTSCLVAAWGSFYNVIQMANKVIISVNSVNAEETKKTQCIAEARFMRGLAYWYLASLWGDVILSDDPTPLVNNPLVNKNPKSDVYEFAIRDMEFAAKYLPETSSAAGRLNRYCAFGMLSRLYLDYSGFKASNFGDNPNVGTRDAEYLGLAQKAAAKVIGSGQFKLLDNYENLFQIANNDNSETLFAFQWVGGLDGNSNAGFGLTNSQASYLAFTSLICGDGGWGAFTEITYDMAKEYESTDTIRRRATWMGAGDYYPELNSTDGGFRIGNGEDEYNSGHDPYNSCLNVKKGVTGNVKDDPAINARNSGVDNYMLRYAEVLLNYADATLGNNASLDNATALGYFNAVRTRAGLPAKTSVTYEDLRHERRVEFCMEGRYWFDLVARSYYRQSEVISYITAQDRGTVPAFLFDAPNNLRINPDKNSTTRAVGEIKAGTFKLPYPESELIQNPKLGDAAASYQFTEERITDLFN
ncbi:MAG: RagB/SusD family nutrient uptake outer membrane protein [Candidatus Azobacteroides sp.]|nr:RagB/SusD family nutrient uptake outer membrane protein [Candidatus Azobacteroides sp.]